MDQRGLFPSPQIVDVETHSPMGVVKAPIAPATGVSRHCSSMGALAAEGFAEQQRGRLLTAYVEHGSLTDAEAEDLTGIDRSSICARRNELVKLGRVEADGGTRRNPKTGISNTLWRISEETNGFTNR